MDVRYPQYRDYLESRVKVNNAMMAMLAGSQLAAHMLQLTVGSNARLAALFPAVPHIKRFDLSSDRARTLLDDADKHVAAVAIPYALGTHEQFVSSAIALLKAASLPLKGPSKNRIQAWNMHPVLFATAGHKPDQDWMQVFDVVREMRNSIIHNGGKTQPNLTQQLNAMGTGSIALWARLNAGQHPNAAISQGRVLLTAEHIATSFAVTKRLGREINQALSHALPTQTWASIAVDDYAATSTKNQNTSAWRRSLTGYVNQNYPTIGITDSHLETAARTHSYWTAAHWA